MLTAKMQLIFVFAAVKNQMLVFRHLKNAQKEMSPSYDKESKTLTAQNFELSYVACKDIDTVFCKYECKHEQKNFTTKNHTKNVKNTFSITVIYATM